MHVLPQTPLDWVLLAVASATAIIIAVAMQDFFVESRVNNPRIRALQDLGLVFAVSHFGVIVRRGSAGPNWAIAGIAMYVAATLLFLSALEAARRVPLERQLEDRFGEAYRTYKLGTGMVLPSLARLFAGRLSQ